MHFQEVSQKKSQHPIKKSKLLQIFLLVHLQICFFGLSNLLLWFVKFVSLVHQTCFIGSSAQFCFFGPSNLYLWFIITISCSREFASILLFSFFMPRIIYLLCVQQLDQAIPQDLVFREIDPSQIPDYIIQTLQHMSVCIFVQDNILFTFRKVESE